MKIKVLLFTVLVSLITTNVPVFSQEECVEPEVLSPETFKIRRTRLLEKMNTGIALMKGSDVAMRNPNVSYEFRQESSFYYLTGFENSSAMLIIVKGNETIADKSILFTSLKDEGNLDSPGFSTTTEVQKNTGIDEVYNRSDFDSHFPEIIKDLTIRYGKEQSEVRIYSDLFNEDATTLIKAQI